LVPKGPEKDQRRAVEKPRPHRGFLVSPHGRKWRFKWNGEWVSRATLAGAFAELDRLLDERERDRQLSDVDGMTVERLIEQWWRRKAREIRESTQLRYESVIRLHIRPLLGGLSADTVRPMDIEDYYACVTYKTGLISRDVLRPAFRWGMTNGLIRRVDGINPFDLARLSRATSRDGNADVEASRVRAVDEKLIPSRAEIEKLLADAEERGDRTWWLYLRIAPCLGGRPGEVCALQAQDIDITQRTIALTKAANGATFKLSAPKRAPSIRTLYVGGDLIDDIEPLITGLKPDDYLFPAVGPSPYGRKLPCWNAHGVSTRLTKACKRAGIPHYTPHSFRHFCATMLLDQGWPPMQVARWLGHKNDTMVRLLYAAHVVEDTRLLLGEAAGRLIRREAPVPPTTCEDD
jgi:integrase